MYEAFEENLKRHRQLEEQLGDPVLIADRARYAAAAKEHGTLARRIKPYLEYKRLTADLAQAEAMVAAETDAEMRGYAEEERNKLAAERKLIEQKLEDILLAGDEDYDSIIMEIRAGTGGDEAALFAGDLYEMYTRYARERGWKVEGISFSPGEAGGFKEVSISVAGEGVFQELRYESGGHRVQRVPKTETQGRIHTSAATVAVMPEPDTTQIEINEANDIEWERMRAGGAGGQHVNKTESAVRLWYKKGTPDELEVKCQDERSQGKNYNQAMRILRSRLYERQQHKLHEARAEQRRTLIGSGARGDRIRTYNFPQNRLTDHRINLTLYKLDAIVMGELTDLIGALKDFDKQQRLGK